MNWRHLPLLVALLVFAACGGVGADEEAERREARAAERADRQAELAEVRARAREEAIAEKKADYNTCVERWSDFREALEQMDSRLSVGMNNADYTRALGDARVQYDKADIDGLSQECLDSARRLENAFNAYLRAMNRWDECIEDYYCDFNDSEAGRIAQQEWAKASTALENSRKRVGRDGALSVTVGFVAVAG